ncbi:MAG: hypothetical protein J1E39_10020 [Eubacterium sp.]|nr:hypothetical protein [Eubacterium sp.]
MTINEVIAKVDSIRPNQYSKDEKIRWLLQVEDRIKNEIYMTHEHDDIEFTDTSEEDEGEITLFAPSPFDELYILFLAWRIDSYNAEYSRANNDAEQFNNIYSDFEKYYNRQHMPIPVNRITY